MIRCIMRGCVCVMRGCVNLVPPNSVCFERVC